MTTLQSADALHLGSVAPDAVYAGGNKVWPVSTEFDPASIPGLTIWLEGGDFVANHWPTRFPNGGGLALLGTPTPVVSSKDGRPVVRYRAQQGAHRASGIDVAAEWTLVYVGRMVGPNAGRVVTGQYPPNNILVGYWNGFQDVMYDSGFTAPSVQVPVVLGEWKMYSGDGTAGLSRLYADGTLLGSTTTALGWGGTLAVSGYSPATLEETCDCEVAEVILYNRRLSDVDRQKVEGYLRGKWWGPPPVDPATVAYMAATGLPATFQPAVDGLVTGLKGKGLWAKMKAVYPFVGGTADLHKWNLIDPRDADAAYRLTYSGPSYMHSAAGGYKPNPAPDYSLGWADTHLAPTGTLDPASSHLSLYSLTTLGGAPRCDMGMYNWDGTTGRFHLIVHYTSGEFYYSLGHTGTPNIQPPAPGDGSGMFVSSRTGANAEAAYRNGAALGSNANASGATNMNVSVLIGALNGYARECSDMSFGFVSIGAGLSATEVADLYTVVQAYQTALGRAI